MFEKVKIANNKHFRAQVTLGHILDQVKQLTSLISAGDPKSKESSSLWSRCSVSSESSELCLDDFYPSKSEYLRVQVNIQKYLHHNAKFLGLSRCQVSTDMQRQEGQVPSIRIRIYLFGLDMYILYFRNTIIKRRKSVPIFKISSHTVSCNWCGVNIYRWGKYTIFSLPLNRVEVIVECYGPDCKKDSFLYPLQGEALFILGAWMLEEKDA